MYVLHIARCMNKVVHIGKALGQKGSGHMKNGCMSVPTVVTGERKRKEVL